MVFQQGDIIRNDYVSYYQGYPGHQSRTVVVGQPSDEQKRTYQTMRDIYRSTVDKCRVGVKASEIYQHATQKFRDAGYWTARIGLGERIATTKTLRRRFFALVGRITRSARRLTLHLPQHWPWETQFTRAMARLRAIPLPA